MGVTSAMLVIFSPQLLSARTADSRPGPGPPTRTSTFFTPCSWAATPAFSAATCAANGVLLREPRKPQPPEVAQESVLRSEERRVGKECSSRWLAEHYKKTLGYVSG